MLTLSKSEILAIFRREIGLDPRRTDCSITVREGLDVDDILLRHIRRWYLNLLDSAPPELLPTGDVASKSGLTLRPDSPWGSVALPQEARRPLRIKLKGWVNDAAVTSPDKAAASVSRMASPFGKPGNYEPLAVAEGHTILVCPPSGIVESLTAIIDPGEDTYILDESLLPSGHILNF